MVAPKAVRTAWVRATRALGLWTLATCAVSLAACRHAPRAVAEAAPAPGDAAAGAEAAPGPGVDWHDTLERARVPALSVAVVRDGRIVLEGAHGLAEVRSATPARPDTSFEAASIGKTVIAISVMKLAEDKRLALDDEVSTRLPFAVRNPAHPNAPITVRMLLAHTSSIRDRVDLLEAAVSPAEAPAQKNALYTFLRSTLSLGGPHHDLAKSFYPDRPGTRMEYSNAGAALAALVVEQVAGEPFDTWSRREVLAPAGAPGAVWRAADVGPARRATPHLWNGSEYVAAPSLAHAVYPVVDLYATARELASLLVVAMGGAVLTRTSVDAMLAPQAPVAPDQGLGWQLVTVGGRRLIGHEGEDRGASTLMFFDPRTRTGAVVLANGDAFASGDPRRAEAMRRLLLSLLDGAW